MAGPVDNGVGKMTNKDWEISSRCLPAEANCWQFKLLNDLSAFGFALGMLPPSSCSTIFQPEKQMVRNGQSLVINLGTGFNISAVKVGNNGAPNVFDAELGHMTLPNSVAKLLGEMLGSKANEIHSIETLFSGKGLALFNQLKTGTEHLEAKAVVELAKAGEARARDTVECYASLLGVLVREITLAYLPFNGIYFCGSAVRWLVQR